MSLVCSLFVFTRHQGGKQAAQSVTVYQRGSEMSGVVCPLYKTTDLKTVATCSDLWLTVCTSIKGLLGLCHILQNFVEYSH